MNPLWSTSGTADLGGAGGTLVVPLPPAANEGEVALVMFAGGPTGPDDPGWTLVGDTDSTPTASAGRMFVWTRQLTAGDITAGQLELAIASTSRSAAAVVGWPDGTTVTDAVFAAHNGFTTGNPSPVATVEQDASTVTHLYGVLGDDNGVVVTWTADPATIEIIQESAASGSRNGTLLIAYEEQDAGATTSRTATTDSEIQNQAATVVLWLETGEREIVDPVGLTDTVTAVLQVGSVTITDQVGITDTDDNYSLAVNSTDSEPVGLTDTVTAVLSNPLSPTRIDTVGLTDTVTATLLGPAITPAARTVAVRQDDTDAQVPGFVKDPDSLLDWRFDWSEWLSEGEHIVDFTVFAPVGITVVHSSSTGSAVTVWLSGGAAGRRYQITCRITTNQGPPGRGRTDDRSFALTFERR